MSTWSGGRPAPGTVLVHLRAFSSIASQPAPQMHERDDKHPDGTDRAGGIDRWTIHLRTDPAASAPGPDWVINDDARLGQGHELAWQATTRSLSLWRAQDRFLLGATRLEGMPATLDWRRRGSWYEIACDGHVVLRCLDPLLHGSGETPGWGIQVDGGSLGDAEVTLLDDTVPGVEEPTTSPEAQALAAVRAVLDGEAEGASALGQARDALGHLPQGSPLQRRLRAYLALVLARQALGSADGDTALSARDAVAELAVAVGTDPVPEGSGMLMALLPVIAARVVEQPPVPERPDQVLARRGLWLDVLGADAVAALAALPEAVSEDLRYELRLIVHAAGCLQHPAGRPARGSGDAWQARPQPVPAEAPAWIIARWRAFARSDPGAQVLPEPPEGLRQGPPGATIAQLVQDAVLEPAGAVRMCCRIRSLLATPAVAQALADPAAAASERVIQGCQRQLVEALSLAPVRESALTVGLLALKGLRSKEAGCQALVASYGEGTPLAQRDPLAYAILTTLMRADPSLIDLVPPALHRREAMVWMPIGAHATSGRPADRQDLWPLLPWPRELKELATYEPLLRGDADATSEAWRMRSPDLPPAQALAAALAMQQALAGSGTDGAAPHWELLAEIPSFTLPVELLAPGRVASDAPTPPAGPDLP